MARSRSGSAGSTGGTGGGMISSVLRRSMDGFVPSPSRSTSPTQEITPTAGRAAPGGARREPRIIDVTFGTPQRISGWHGGTTDKFGDEWRPGGRPTPLDQRTGNDKPDWQGLYLARDKEDAAGYVEGDDRGDRIGKVGRWEHTEDLTPVRVPKLDGTPEEQAADLRRTLGVPEGRTLMDHLADERKVLEIAGDEPETIVPWRLAEGGGFTEVLGYSNTFRRGESWS